MSDWKISEAKARFSEMLEHCAAEPQVIFKRKKPVAVVMDVKDHEKLEAEKTGSRNKLTMSELMKMVQESGEEDLKLPPRTDRPMPEFED